MDVYIENIKARFGSFRYAEVKTPFNPQTVDQHLIEMIPGLKGTRGRRKSIAKSSDLTLKIVKTADNHLSVVKKDQMTKESPQIKRTIDITGDGVVSRTPTPPAPISSRRKTEVRGGRPKTAARYSDGNTKFDETKSYQMLRRKSMAVEKAEPKKVGAVIFKRKSIHSNFEAKPVDEPVEPEKPAEPKESHKVKTNSATKKRKPSVEEQKQVPEKRAKADAKTDTKPIDATPRQMSEEKIVCEENILSSVGLMKRTSPLKTTGEVSTKQKLNAKKSTAKKVSDKNGAEKMETNMEKQIVLVPFLEIKEENSESLVTSNISDQNVSSTQTSMNTTDANLKENISLISDELSSSIKTEIDSDDGSLMIIDDDFAEKAKESSTPNRSNGRGSISVRDINKMTDKETAQKHSIPSEPLTRARKSFPKSATNTTTSVLKPRTTNALNRSTNSMVCIPLDGLPPLDLITSSSPPPLSVVTSNVSLLARNQPSTSNVAVLSSEPPPLSLSSIQVTPSQNTDMPTISNGMITEQMASAITDSMLREPPRLTSRPKAPLRSDGDGMFPSESGSVCRTLMENAHKMTDFFRSVIEDTLSDLAATTNPEAKIRLMEIELEKQKNAHAKEIADLKANTDRLLAEMKKSMEKERARVINETRKQCEMERIRSIEEAKKKQWCAFCGKEAQFFCCWNTSYCNHLCQRKHW